MDVKNILKQIKLNESLISLILGLLIVIIVGFLVIRYFRSGDTSSPEVPGESVNSQEVYIVKENDSLWTIAEAKYGSGYNWVDIKEENNLENPGVIEVGQELVIPQAQASQEAEAAEEEVVVESTETIDSDTYTVERGDNLWDISVRAYGDGYRWVEIAEENNLENPDIIHAGNVLEMPE